MTSRAFAPILLGAMLFGVVVFLSAFLLFQVQLIVAKHLLPWFGGTPAVWTTSQMFFQVLLLGGYSYAHLLTRTRGTKRQSQIHLAVLFVATASVFALALWAGKPLLAPSSMKPAGDENPVLLLLLILALSVGLPFFVVSTTGPLLQQWHARRSTSLTRTYRLYALSNVGSLLGLLSYPFGVERLLDLPQQAWLWAVLFALFAAGCGAVAWRSWQDSELIETTSIGSTDTALTASGPGENIAVDPSHGPHARPIQMVLWLMLSMTSSVTFLATTNQLSQDVAAVPFLWVLPLSIYLLTFTICFDRPNWYSRRWTVMAAALTSIAVGPSATGGLPVPVQIVAYGAFLFSFCMLCHGELFRLRPGVRQLTLYYLLIALGGALGGIFVSLGAPIVFSDLWEFHLAIVVGWMVIGLVWATEKSSPFHIGDRALFATLVTITSWLVIRYLIERTRFGGIEWVSDNGWPVTIVVGLLVGGIFASLRKFRLGQLSLWPQLLWLVVVLLSAMFLLQRMPSEADGVIYAARNFYGVVRVSSVPAPGGEARRLIHGTTVHGAQVNLPGYRTTPTSYYSRTSGIAQISRLLRSHNLRRNNFTPGLHFGVLGMGIGTMSAFGQSADRFRYYEINPEVIEIASGHQPYFTFVRDSASDVAVVTGDARLSLERELREGGSQQFDMLVMDAFSSDSVPVHLLTVEAFRLYAAHLRDEESILAVNVTNRYLGLEPVVAANAQDLGLQGIRVDSPGDPPILQESSWILLARDPQVLRQLSGPTGAARQVTDRFVRFTDDYSNLFRVLKGFGRDLG